MPRPWHLAEQAVIARREGRVSDALFLFRAAAEQSRRESESGRATDPSGLAAVQYDSAAEALLSKLPDGVTEASLSGHSYAPSLVHAGEEVCKRCQVVIAVGDSQAGVCGGVR